MSLELDERTQKVCGSNCHRNSVAEDINHKTETIPGVDKSSEDGNHEAAPQLGGAPFQVELQLRQTAYLSLLNVVLEHRKGSRASGEFRAMGSVIGFLVSTWPDYKPLSFGCFLWKVQQSLSGQGINRVMTTNMPNSVLECLSVGICDSHTFGEIRHTYCYYMSSMKHCVFDCVKRLIVCLCSSHLSGLV